MFQRQMSNCFVHNTLVKAGDEVSIFDESSSDVRDCNCMENGFVFSIDNSNIKL